MKKLLALLLAIMISTCLFTACFGEKEDSAGNGPAVETAVENTVNKYLKSVYKNEEDALSFTEETFPAYMKTMDAIGRKESLKSILMNYVGAPDDYKTKVSNRLDRFVDPLFEQSRYYSVGVPVINEDDLTAAVHVTLSFPDSEKIVKELEKIEIDVLMDESGISEKLENEEIDKNQAAFELLHEMFNNLESGDSEIMVEEHAEIQLKKVDDTWIIVDVIKAMPHAD